MTLSTFKLNGRDHIMVGRNIMQTFACSLGNNINDGILYR